MKKTRLWICAGLVALSSSGCAKAWLGFAPGCGDDEPAHQATLFELQANGAHDAFVGAPFTIGASSYTGFPAPNGNGVDSCEDIYPSGCGGMTSMRLATPMPANATSGGRFALSGAGAKGAGVFVRGNNLGGIVLLYGRSAAGGPLQVQLHVVRNGVTGLDESCEFGTDSTTDCPFSDNLTNGDDSVRLQLKVKGCSPDVTVETWINGTKFPKLSKTLTGFTQTDDSAGFVLFGKDLGTPAFSYLQSVTLTVGPVE